MHEESASKADLRFLSEQPDPFERLAQDQGRALFLMTFGQATAAADLFLKTGKRPVVLECGHLTLTRALMRAKCRRCGQMIRTGYDYDAFRNHGAPDDFSWPEDPFRLAHEAAES